MTRNDALSAARVWAHDRVCMSSGCVGDSEHARRTQHAFARAVVDATDDDQVIDAVHRLCCLGEARGDCPARDGHRAWLRERTLPGVKVAIGR